MERERVGMEPDITVYYTPEFLALLKRQTEHSFENLQNIMERRREEYLRSRTDSVQPVDFRDYRDKQ